MATKVKPRDSFAEHILEQLAPLGGVVLKRLFGAACLYCDGSAFALLDEGVLYFKIDDGNRAAFAAVDSAPFRYFHKGRGVFVPLGYGTIPDHAIDDTRELQRWARSAIAAAARKRALALKPKAAKKAAKKPAKKTARRPTQKKPATKGAPVAVRARGGRVSPRK